MLTEGRNPRTERIDTLSTLDMLRAIHAEDATVAGAVGRALPAIARAVDAIAERLRGGGRVFYVGAGSSGREALTDAIEWEPTFSVAPDTVQVILAGGEAAFGRSVEDAEDDAGAGRAAVEAAGVSERDGVVGIAASGYTPYTIAALEEANARGAATVAVACNAPAPLFDVAQIGIAALVGPEVITGSTRMKAGTAQKMILNMLSTASMIQLGKVYSNLMVDVRVSNQKLAARARRAVSDVTGASDGEAARLLDLTGNEVKTAIVVGLLGLAPDEARGRLADAQGMLHRVIGAK